MTTNTQLPKKSIFLNMIFWAIKLRAGFITIILVFASIFIYQYWQDLTQNTLKLVATVKTDISTLMIYMPENSTYENSGLIADITIVAETTGKEVLESDIIEINFTGEDLSFEPSQIVMSKSELTADRNTYNIKVSSIEDLQGEIALGIQVVNLDKTEVSIEKNLFVTNTLKNPVVFITGFLSFITAILSFIIQIRNFFSKA